MYQIKGTCVSGTSASLACGRVSVATAHSLWDEESGGMSYMWAQNVLSCFQVTPRVDFCSQELCKKYIPLSRLPAPTEHLCLELPVAHFLTTRATGSCLLYRLKVWAQGEEAPSPPVCIAFSLGTKAEMVATFWLHRSPCGSSSPSCEFASYSEDQTQLHGSRRRPECMQIWGYFVVLPIYFALSLSKVLSKLYLQSPSGKKMLSQVKLCRDRKSQSVNLELNLKTTRIRPWIYKWYKLWSMYFKRCDLLK